MDRVRKNFIQLFEEISFFVDIKTNLKIVNFFDISFNLNNGTLK